MDLNTFFIDKGKKGLANIGSTCYINTAVQCLSYCLDFLHYVLSGRYKMDRDLDNSFDVQLGTHTFKVKYLKSYTSSKFSYEIAKKMGRLTDGTDISKVLECMAENSKLAPKCLSYAILGSLTKIALFHWIFWRWIFYTKNQREIFTALEKVIAPLDLGFFLSNMELLENMNYLTRKMTTQEAKQLRQELNSEQKQTF